MSLAGVKGGQRSESFDDWVKSTRQLWAAFNEGEYDRVLPLLDPEIELQDWPDVPDARWHRGIEGVGGWVANMLEVIANPRIALRDFAPVDDSRFLVEADFSAVGKRSGVNPPPIHAFAVVTMRAGKFRRMELYRERAEALQAAGLSE